MADFPAHPEEVSAAWLGAQIGAQVGEFLIVLNSDAAVAAFAGGGALSIGPQIGAVAGPVGLVGLIGPEIARQLSSHRGVSLIASALSGAIVMVAADLVGRLLLAPIEVPVGIVTAIVGAPFLLWILLRPAPRFQS